MNKGLNKIIARFKKSKVLVIGDLILDEFIWGDVNRISPEAPVPVVRVKSQSYLPGGAANVANNIASLGAQVQLAGIVGNDNAGQLLIEELSKRSINTEGIFKDSRRPTTLKTRIIAHHQQVVRIDKESQDHIDGYILNRIIDFAEAKINDIDSILIEDYGKGVINPLFLKKIKAIARRHKKIISVDPKEDHFSYYKYITVISPNRHEAYIATHIKNNTDDGLNKCGLLLLNRLKCKAVLITLGEEGMRLFEKGGRITHIPTMTQEVFDVSGAGDTVIATLTLALASGAKMKEAALLANYAAGIVVGKVGTATCCLTELKQRIKERSKLKS
jgi:D-beta-D-heptose 7-phosphate kinase/D-beta-D-heptose 1-phosphate adenosyltransferase